MTIVTLGAVHPGDTVQRRQRPRHSRPGVSLIGPSKGKHFVNVLGPCVAPLDEVEAADSRAESQLPGALRFDPAAPR